jgi:hypothetical protein
VVLQSRINDGRGLRAKLREEHLLLLNDLKPRLIVNIEYIRALEVAFTKSIVIVGNSMLFIRAGSLYLPLFASRPNHWRIRFMMCATDGL